VREAIHHQHCRSHFKKYLTCSRTEIIVEKVVIFHACLANYHFIHHKCMGHDRRNYRQGGVILRSRAFSNAVKFVDKKGN